MSFSSRHIGPDARELEVMCTALGVSDVAELIDQVVPASVRIREPLGLPAGLSEESAQARLRERAARNHRRVSLIGQGYSGTFTPAVIRRNILEDPSWYTAYTPYQPEISQGRLEAVLNFQTMVMDLTGMQIANASLLDEATAAAEAMAMCLRATKSTSRRFVVDADTHPQTLAVLSTRAEPIGVELVVSSLSDLDELSGAFGVLIQYPSSTGRIRALPPIVEAARAAGVMTVVAADLLALCLLQSPGSAGADVVVGSSQRFGVPMGFGGPHAAYLATRSDLARSMPGRLVGVSTDTEGRAALRLALQTREQHIRREKATSNICTAQVLLAVMAGMYAVYHGPDGLRAIAERVVGLTDRLVAGLRAGGLEVRHDTWFDTVAVEVPVSDEAISAAAAAGYDLRRIDSTSVGISLDETSSVETVDALVAALCATVGEIGAVVEGVPDSVRRTDAYLTHPVFQRHRSEHELLRYLRRLSDMDLALDRTMIPLGSCTMKLNAAAEMEPISWPELADVHPFAPADQTEGWVTIIRELEQMMVEVTGYAAVSLQPNAGSQGEFAGLLAIRGYHASRGETGRNVCLIPSSAHGTNAASAVMAGMQVVVVTCDEHGNVDLDDLRAKATANSDRLAACMVTYPSTHGVFEAGVVEVCDIVHAHGGQVYVDGANLNALVGLAKPGRFGADVSHLNLHKTFCIPHGGGGPGVGPVAVAAHLAPFLPSHPARGDAAPSSNGAVGPVSAAPFGSAGILPISWMYVTMMGGEGLARATEVAIVSANYLAHRLSPYFPVLYTGANGRVAHECIIDLRPITKATGVTVDDIAKRLMDHGFHAPTMSFPVAGTLMIEPTESESLAELDRFVAAMASIHAEITDVAEGRIAVDDSPLRHAPHTAEDVVRDDWNRAYSRQQAAFPSHLARGAKYWPPVSRIDAAAGDRHLVCACPPIDAYT